MLSFTYATIFLIRMSRLVIFEGMYDQTDLKQILKALFISLISWTVMEFINMY